MPKSKLPRSYGRRPPSREPYDTVLIVCEGSKSEPAYLRRLCYSYQLSTANIVITSEAGSDPLNIVSFAEAEAERATEEGQPYDRVYCVFDRDSHANFEKAVNRINNSGGRLRAIISFPCFEVWVLLHFTGSTAPIEATGGRSACDNVGRRIRESGWPEYIKQHPLLYEKLEPYMEDAITRGKRLDAHNRRTGSKNPSTAFHTLVDYLRKLKS